MCRWSRECDSRRRMDDHLCLVAGISSLQIGELTGRDVATTAGLAATPLPLPWKPERGAAVSYEKIREQARVQVEGREEGRAVYETIEPEPDVGLAMLPAPSAGDIFFDFEGDPFVGPGGFRVSVWLSGGQREGSAGIHRALGPVHGGREECLRGFRGLGDRAMGRIPGSAHIPLRPLRAQRDEAANGPSRHS